MLNFQLTNSGNDAMVNLQNMWYNCATAGLGLDPNSFQLMQTSEPFPQSSGLLWDICDSIPALSLTNYYSGSQMNSFFSDYGGVLSVINPQNSGAFVKDLGPALLAQWADYKKSILRQSHGKIDWISVYSDWADAYIDDPNVAARTKAEYKQTLLSIVGQAIDAYNTVTPQTRSYSVDLATLTNAVASGVQKSISLNSKTASTDISNTWARCNGGSWFWKDSTSTTQSSSIKIATSNVTVNATFEKVATIPFKPVNWFSSSAFHYAYADSSTTVWPANVDPTWNTTFGDNGNIKRLATALTVVDGIHINITSDATFNSSEQTFIKTQSSHGFWPFYSQKHSTTSTTSFTFSDEGHMTINTVCPTGNPLIFGVSVQSIDSLFK